MKNNREHRPLFDYSIEECANMPIEEFDRLLEEDNEYVERKYAILNESNEPEPEFNSIEEIRAYYHCKPLDEVINNRNKIFS